MKNYKELDVWIASRKLVKAVYGLILSFLNLDRYSLISPVNRSVVSLPSYIAEGIGGPSDNDTVQFTDIAKGSPFEPEVQKNLAFDLKYIPKDHLDIVLNENASHQKSLNGFINYFKNKK